MPLSPSTLKTMVAAGLAAIAIGAAASAQAGDLRNDDDDFDERPRVERRVVIEERRVVQPVYETRTVEERRVVRTTSEPRILEERRVARPVYEPRVVEERRAVRPAYESRVVERPIQVRPVFDGGPVYGRPVDEDGDCRVTVKRHVNHWGEMIVERIRVCD